MSQIKLTSWIILLDLVLLARGSDFTGLDDTEVVFKINWPGKSTVEFPEFPVNAEPYIITTANNEKYQCHIPDTTQRESESTENIQRVDPMELLEPLFMQSTCSFRLESYWTYEICHGRHVRQYHEEREGTQVKTHQYFLGTFDKQKFRVRNTEKWLKQEHSQSEPPVKKVDGINMPYVEVEMTDGTMCDLSNKPRSIKLLYICYEHGKHEILSLEETSTCEYEAVVLSPLICAHPDYKTRGMGENEINCLPLEGSPRKPHSLLALEVESLKFRHQKVADEKAHKVHAILHVDKEGQDGEARVRVEIHPVDILEKHNIDESGNALLEQGPSDTTPVLSFLSGKNCLHGGNGWWKYEFCYGRSVVQYHIERDGSKTIVDLGKFDRDKHIQWIKAHPQKRPKPLAERKQLSHFYSDGSSCDKTGKLRQTEVRLKCIENPTTSPSSVSLFLLEPKICEYILGVESPLICDILQHADENGLMREDAGLELEDFKSSMEPASKKEDDLDERIANSDEL
ncbi:endoplasmic reticulum lectin 1 [Venturia canescens]|uniref:endoplasmic reticulum lectin 1 n=1 Tax=Venturia canescens TaxID=32260 RepID=UPI001C9D31FE|nr:endoplasmic reticulum lectin 1 [Venturia canescens]